jgi:hypothetical protein
MPSRARYAVGFACFVLVKARAAFAVRTTHELINGIVGQGRETKKKIGWLRLSNRTAQTTSLTIRNKRHRLTNSVVSENMTCKTSCPRGFEIRLGDREHIQTFLFRAETVQESKVCTPRCLASVHWDRRRKD